MRRDTLFIATLGYLLAPNVIFLLGWLRPSVGVVCAAAVIACMTDVVRRSETNAPKFTWRAWVWIGALAAFWAYSAGMGDLNAQLPDYLKHNLVFHDLVAWRWPVSYASPERGNPLLCYYLAYYLPASLLGKLFGISCVAPFSLIWGFFGIGLAFAWLCRLGGSRGIAVVVLFLLIDGFCWLVGLYPLAQKTGLLPGALNHQWWQTDGFTSRFWTFVGNQNGVVSEAEPTQLMWVPQHTLAAWLAASCVLRSLAEDRPPRYVILVHATIALWSPFVAVGLIPFTLWACARGWRESVAWPNLLGAIALCVPVGLYFQAHFPLEYSGWLFAQFARASDWLRYLLFLVLTVGLFWAGAWLVRRRFSLPGDTHWRLLGIASLTYVAATFVHLGRYNDWQMRVSMPALFVLHLTLATLAKDLWSSDLLLKHRLALVVVLLLSAQRSLKIWWLAPQGHLKAQRRRTSIVTAWDYARGLVSLPRTQGFDFPAQYLGDRASLFGRYLMKTEPPPL